MQDKKPNLNEYLRIMVLGAVVAVLTVPILAYTGIQDLLVDISIHLAKTLFRIFGITP